MAQPLQNKRIAIIGSGIWGLSLAYFLGKKSADRLHLSVLESSSRPGGMIQSTAIDGFLLENGPNGFLDSNPSTFNLCKALGLESELLPASSSAARNRFLFLNNRLHKLPASLLGMAFSSVLSLSAKMRIIAEPWKTRRCIPAEESIADFFRARVGNEVATTLADAFITGIWGGDPEKLSLPSCFPKWRQMEQEYGSLLRGVRARRIAKLKAARQKGLVIPAGPRMWSLKKGLGQLIENLAKRLPLGVQIRTKVTALQSVPGASGPEWMVFTEGKEKPQRFDQVILACPAQEQSRLLQSLDKPASELLAEITSTPIAVVGLLFPDHQIKQHSVKPDGFGYLTPQRDSRPVLGVQWCSSIFPDHRAPPGHQIWRALVGGPKQASLLDLDDSELAKVVLAELKTVGGWELAPEITRIFRWKRAIPQYTLGHAEVVRKIEARIKNIPGLILAGSTFRGVAINDCVEQAEILAERLCQDMV
jgi:oxygen-dependent protoporphyrinogen oxidase